MSLFSASLFFKGLALKRKLKEGPLVTKTAPAAPGKIFTFSVKTVDQADKSLADYKGQVLLIVNTASRCGFTPQYETLEAYYETYRPQGLRVLAFPSNDFGAQEPGTDAEIKTFCRTKFNVGFDLFSKIPVTGPGMHPLYRFLTEESGFNGPIPWNFTKFLVGRDGRIAARFEPPDDPMSKKVTEKTEALLRRTA